MLKKKTPKPTGKRFNSVDELMATMSPEFQQLHGISGIAAEQHEWLNSVGWSDKTTPLEDLMLIVSEAGEAANECRGKDFPTAKFNEELADIVLRVFGLAGKHNIDIEAAILAKMAKNKKRGTRGRLK